MRSCISLAIVVCYIAAFSSAASPGFQTCLTEGAFEYAADVGTTILEQQLSSVAIPDITQKVDTPIGHVTFTLSNINLGSLAIPKAALVLDPSSGITASVSNVEATAKLDWKYDEDSWPHVSDSGSADVAVSQTNLAVVVGVGMKDQRPTVTANSVSVQVGHIDITLHGGASWLYNIFIGAFQSSIQHAVEQSLQQAIQQAIDQNAEKALATLPIVENINSNINVDFGLVANPVFTKSYMDTQHHGEFDSIKHPSPFPGVPATMPDTIGDSQLQMFFSAWSLNSLMSAFLEANMLHTVVTPDMVPANFPYPLNTNSSLWKYVVPTLPTEYPNMPMRLVLDATSAPVITLSTSGAFIETKGVIWVQVGPLENGSIFDAFALETYAATSGVASVHRNNITGSLTFLNASCTPVNSTVGPVSEAMLNAVLGLMFKVMVPYINQLIGPGFPLPSVQGVDLVQPSVVWDAGYMAVLTNYTYTPPSLASKTH